MTLDDKISSNKQPNSLSGFSDQEVLGCLVDEGMTSNVNDNDFLLDNEQEIHKELQEP